jgi:hypothetical protein
VKTVDPVFVAVPGVRLLRREFREARHGSFPIPLNLESIGDDMKEPWRRLMRGDRSLAPHQIDRLLRRGTRLRPVWVARILGVVADGRPIRRFLRGNKDYSRANGVGSRGVYYSYLLFDGPIYEIQENINWTKTHRAFWRFLDGVRHEISFAEVMACLEK